MDNQGGHTQRSTGAYHCHKEPCFSTHNQVKLATDEAVVGKRVSGRVIAVQDGDTLTIQSQNQKFKVRLMGIDAPELDQPYGRVSRDALAAAVLHRDIEVAGHKTDRYGRIIGQIWRNGDDLNLGQIEAGLAWHYTQYSREQTHEDRQRYGDAEVRVRQARSGLWRDLEPMAPWMWRKAHK